MNVAFCSRLVPDCHVRDTRKQGLACLSTARLLSLPPPTSQTRPFRRHQCCTSPRSWPSSPPLPFSSPLPPTHAPRATQTLTLTQRPPAAANSAAAPSHPSAPASPRSSANSPSKARFRTEPAVAFPSSPPRARLAVGSC